MSKISVLAKLTVKQGSKDQFIEAFDAMMSAVQGEEGTELYVMNWDTKNDHLAYVYELYSDADALGEHSGSDAMAALIGALGEVLDGAPEISILTPTSAKGVEL